MGIEYQNVKFSTLQPAWSHGQFDYNGTSPIFPTRAVPPAASRRCCCPRRRLSHDDRAPIPRTGGFDYSGGSDQVYASNINKTYDAKKYFATYFQDDWKMTPKLTLNLGIRWDYFGPINETNGGQANFVPYPIPARALERRRCLSQPPARTIGPCPRAIRSIRLRRDFVPAAPGTCQGVGCYGCPICWQRMESPLGNQQIRSGAAANPEEQSRASYRFRVSGQPETGGTRWLRPVLQLVREPGVWAQHR